MIKRFENFVPQGWVNVKVDEQLFIRIGKYVYALDELLERPSDTYNLYKKIEILSNVDKHTKNANIQTKISIITLLQYLNEIKNHFNPSSAGFLLEGFIASLIHGVIIPGYGPKDITTKTSYDELDAVRFKTEGKDKRLKQLDYQIKLYKKGSNININWTDICDYYVICLKDESGNIEVHILDGKNAKKDEFIGEYCVLSRGGGDYEKGTYVRDGKIILNTNKLRGNKFKKTLNITNIEKMIQSIGDDIKNSISDVYNNLSELEYNIESMISGYDKEREKINPDQAKTRTDSSIEGLSGSIDKLYNNLN